MKVRCFQHVPFEGLGLIEPWLRSRSHEIATTRWWAGDKAPAPDAYDWLIVMGGPMNVYQHRDHPWLVAEKAALAAAFAASKRVLGVCLGAQLIADVLGAKIVQNPVREIGWWPVRSTALDSDAAGVRYAFPAFATVLHWHGDTFSLPPGAIRLAESKACAEQAFAWGERVLGLQFHLEMGAESVAEIAAGCADELVGGGSWVQSDEALVRGAREHGASAEVLLHRLLAAMESA
jgi:GMP synthase-like glutamine amidotransferase